MKITKTQLRRLIREELYNVEDEELGLSEALPDETDATDAPLDLPGELGAEEATEEPEAKRARDVDILLRTIDKINMPDEYQQVLDAIVSHGAEVRGGKIALAKLARTLAQTASKMK
jgi:hypothetical protein